MKYLKVLLPVLAIFVFIFMIVMPAYAIFCPYCGASNPDDANFCVKCGGKLTDSVVGDKYTQACKLFENDKYDEVISLIGDYCNENPTSIKYNLILSKAYLEKCELMKENGDEKYKDMVLIPFNIGKRLYNINYSSDSLYILAKALVLNGRAIRGKKYIKKAINQSTSSKSNIDYYFVLADAESSISRFDKKYKEFSYLRAKKKYEKIISMDITNDQKALAYYKLAIHLEKSGQKKKGKKAYSSALELAQKESLKTRIQAGSDVFK